MHSILQLRLGCFVYSNIQVGTSTNVFISENYSLPLSISAFIKFSKLKCQYIFYQLEKMFGIACSPNSFIISKYMHLQLQPPESSLINNSNPSYFTFSNFNLAIIHCITPTATIGLEFILIGYVYNWSAILTVVIGCTLME